MIVELSTYADRLFSVKTVAGKPDAEEADRLFEALRRLPRETFEKLAAKIKAL